MHTENSRTNLKLNFDDYPETTLRVGSADYTLRLLHGEITIGGHLVMGYCDFENQVIGISDRLSPQRRRRTLWHELMHVWQVELAQTQRPLNFEEVAELVEQGLGWIDTSVMSQIDRILAMPTSNLLPDEDTDEPEDVIVNGESMKAKAAKR